MKKQRICVFRTTSNIGDSIFSNFIFRELKKEFPQAEVAIIVPEPTAAIYLSNPHIDRFTILPPMEYPEPNPYAATPMFLNYKILWALFRLLVETWIRPIDVLITDTAIHTRRNKFYFSLLRTKKIIHLANTPALDRHISQVHKQQLQQLGLQNIDTTYELFIPQAQEKEALNFLQQHRISNGKFIVLNPTGSIAARTLSREQIRLILQEIAPNTPVVLLDYKHQYTEFASQAVLYTSQQILAVAALLKYAYAVVTVDTSILHIADTYQKPMLAIYADNRYSNINNKVVCASRLPTTHYIYSTDKISDIPLAQLQQHVQQFIQDLKAPH